jgi:hypothetical protein
VIVDLSGKGHVSNSQSVIFSFGGLHCIPYAQSIMDMDFRFVLPTSITIGLCGS